MENNLILATLGSTGIYVRRGALEPTVVMNYGNNPKPFRAFACSQSGSYYAYCDSYKTIVMDARTSMELFSFRLPRTTEFAFSPRERVIATYEPRSELSPRAPNLRFWSLINGRFLNKLVANRMDSWRPQWTEDESTVFVLDGSDLLVYNNNDFEHVEKRDLTKVMCHPKSVIHRFELSPGTGEICFSLSGFRVTSDFEINFGPQRGLWPVPTRRYEVYRFKGFACSPLRDSNVFVMQWHPWSSIALVATKPEVQDGYVCALFAGYSREFISKCGPIHSVACDPVREEFCVSYGNMPSNFMFASLNGRKRWDLGTKHYSKLLYNCFGNVLLAAEIANTSVGKMDFYDVEAKEMIISLNVPNYTHVEWAPDGQHYAIAQCARRNRKEKTWLSVWHYTGNMIYEELHEKSDEIRQIQWRTVLETNVSVIEDRKRILQQNINEIYKQFAPLALKRRWTNEEVELDERRLNMYHEFLGLHGGEFEIPVLTNDQVLQAELTMEKHVKSVNVHLTTSSLINELHSLPSLSNHT